MVDYGAISVIVFKVKNDQPYFYLVKRSSEIPIFPDTWTPIAGTTNKNDQEVYSFLYDKLGDIIGDMSSRLTAVRLMLERNLFSPFEEEQATKTKQDVYERIKSLDPDLLSVYLHSMIPSGFEKIIDGENIFNVKQYIFISAGSSIFERTNLINESTIYINTRYKLEAKSRWFSAKQIQKFYEKSKKLFLPSFAFLKIGRASCRERV